ncbi:2858_t:CDS:2, partial [Racocetra fulgida]
MKKLPQKEIYDEKSKKSPQNVKEIANKASMKAPKKNVEKLFTKDRSIHKTSKKLPMNIEEITQETSKKTLTKCRRKCQKNYTQNVEEGTYKMQIKYSQNVKEIIHSNSRKKK